MAGRYLLDTNILVALFAGEARVREALVQAEETFVPSVAIGELCFGARKSGRVRANLERIDELAASTVVLVCDAETGRRYGEIKAGLWQKGHPLPENDIWIAALAVEHRLVLATRDAHFAQVEGLETVAW